jgi:hypothetical protein
VAQNSVFHQVIKLISRRDFEASVQKHNGNHGTRQLDCWTWFGSLLFGQLTGHDSIRAIERTFCHGRLKMEKLGFRGVCRSTLSDANKLRPLGILEDTFESTLKKAKFLCPNGHGFKFKGDVYALDSSVIDLCLSLNPWANYQCGRGGIRLHTAIDLAGELPDVVVVTPAKSNEIPIAEKYFHFKPGATVVVDRGYWCAKWFNHLNDSGAFFVTRARRNNKFKVVESRPTDRTRGYICDQIVYQKTRPGRPKFQGLLRKIAFNDPDTGKRFTFITNRFDLATSTICALYKARWKVELFFKAMKQNLKIKKFLGTSSHAVKAQILVALIAYLLVQMIRYITKSRISLCDAMAVIGTLVLLNEPLKRLLGDLPRVTRHPSSSQLTFNI